MCRGKAPLNVVWTYIYTHNCFITTHPPYRKSMSAPYSCTQSTGHDSNDSTFGRDTSHMDAVPLRPMTYIPSLRVQCQDYVRMYRDERTRIVQEWTENYIQGTILRLVIQRAKEGETECEIDGPRLIASGVGTIKPSEWMATDESSWMCHGGVIGLIREWARRSEFDWIVKDERWLEPFADKTGSNSASTRAGAMPYIYTLAYAREGKNGSSCVYTELDQMRMMSERKIGDSMVTLQWSLPQDRPAQ